MNEHLKSCGNPSRGRYVQGCRCYMCRVANSEYEFARSHGANERKILGQASADACRRRVALLLDSGWTKRGICREAGVSRNTLAALLDGHRNTPELNGGRKKRTCKANAEFKRRIFALPMHPKRRADGELIDAAPVIATLLRLHRRVSYAEISRKSGIPVQTVYGLVYRRPARCTYGTMRKLALAMGGLGGKDGK